jgi:hypothetical protein
MSVQRSATQGISVHIKTALATVVLGLAATSQAATVVVTPTDVASSPALNQWYLTNFRDVSTGFTSTTTAAITSTEPRNGNGSVQMSLTNGSGKADYAYTWGFIGDRTLGNLTALSFDWYRSSSSTNPAAQQPALRLLFDADGNEATTADRGYLIWEQTYQTLSAVALDTWVSSDTLAGDFWQRRFSPGTTIEQFDTDLGEWAAGAQFAGALQLSDQTAILGIEFGIGSGWNGAFTGFIDNVTYGFGTAPATTFNFELAQGNVPEPGTLALVGLALAGVAGISRRRRA